MGKKIKLQTLVYNPPNSDGFYIFYISQGSVATQLRCSGMRSNHFIINFPQNVMIKNFENRSIFGEDMDESMWLSFLAHPVYIIDRQKKQTEPIAKSETFEYSVEWQVRNNSPQWCWCHCTQHYANLFNGCQFIDRLRQRIQQIRQLFRIIFHFRSPVWIFKHRNINIKHQNLFGSV